MTHRSGIIPVALLAAATMWAACSAESDYGDYVARLGDRTLTREQLMRDLSNSPLLQDSTEAGAQIIERWVMNELLFKEAVERGLRTDPEVQRLLADNERSVLISALVNRYYEEEAVEPDEDAIRTYYEQHREQLSLKEPFVRVRHVTAASEGAATTVRDSLRSFDTENAGDERFAAFLDRRELPASRFPPLPDSWFPLSQLIGRFPGQAQALGGLQAGTVLTPFEIDGTWHIIQMAGRIPAGTIPDMEMVRNDLRERVSIEMRKQLFARQVQRLRTRALAQEDLEIRE